jgi:hypothetical protein
MIDYDKLIEMEYKSAIEFKRQSDRNWATCGIIIFLFGITLIILASLGIIK